MINSELASFLEGGVSIFIGTRNDQLDPRGARVTAVKIEPDGAHITTYVPKAAAGPILADLEANRQAAVGFARPRDDRAWQIKGVFAGARTASARERTLVTRQWEAFLEDLSRIGIPAPLLEAWEIWPATAIRLRVTALFSQTPGPGAGAPMS